jgi:penicillin amidase
MKVLRFLLSSAIAIVLVYTLNTRIAPLPPLGKFLDPFGGFWQNSESADYRPPEETQLQNLLKDSVKVVYDDRLVPHIFATNDDDLYFMQGYITARHRLWQMEFQTHAASGRIAEIVGEVALDLDRTSRRRGMVYGAQNTLKALEKEPLAKLQADAYTRGINAYISNLHPKDYPVEYKLLGYAPEPWTPLKTALLLKYMSNTLNSGEADRQMLNALNYLGRPMFDLLFPDMHPGQDPIVNGTTPWNFKPVEIKKPQVKLTEQMLMFSPDEESQPGKNIGSNNWAVAGSKTASGNPILCDDPHLNLNLPSIWFEMQLTSPTVRVYGVTLPGAPNIIIGFNDSVAWGVTNAQRDVLDWYVVEYKDNTRDAYRLDGKWEPTRKVVEEIKIRDGKTFYDTVAYTYWGPVVHDQSYPMAEGDNRAYAMRWIAHDESFELLAFHQLNRARNYNEFVGALQYYSSPAQNFAFASASGDIAMHIQGTYPAKWKEQGKFLMDGSSTEMRWQAFIPNEHNVKSLNPPRGFVSSANQHPVDSLYPYYVHSSNYEYFRNRRINQLLTEMKDVTPEMMMKMHNDNFNLQASESLPYMMSLLDTASLTAEEKKAFDQLASWDFYNEAEYTAPIYYTIWWDSLNRFTWDELRQSRFPMPRPEEFVMIRIMKERPDLSIFDIVATPAKETLTDVVRLAFKEAVKSANDWQAQRSSEPMYWTDYRNTSVMHLARLMPFSVPRVRNGGFSGIVNATGRRAGPSWRMIVELDKNGPKGWGIYPGGQSGNPGSPFYVNMVSQWEKGQYNELWFMKNPSEKGTHLLYQQTFKP